MKNLLFIMMAFMVSLGAYAQEATTNVEDEEIAVVSEQTVLDTIYLSSESLTSPEPIIISASLPSDVREVLNVGHPCQPGYLHTWSYGNGIITITIPIGELTGLSQGNITIYARDAIYIILLFVI